MGIWRNLIINNIENLKELQELPLEYKIMISKQRIKEWYEYWDGQVYISFSGGKDSTVLLHMVREIYPNVEAVFVDTGLEYPELKEFVKSTNNVLWIKPEIPFNKIIEKYGYLVISKEISNVVQGAKKDTNNTRYQRLQGTFINPKTGELSNYNCSKYKYLLEAPFNISDKCCDYIKKKPAKLYDKQSGKKPILGLMANESTKRKKDYLKTGCNAFEKENPQSQPMGFWKEQDVLQYLKEFNIPYASIYGDIVEVDGKLETTGEKRTGCMFCMFGVHLEKEPNRFQRMAQTHPKQYDYCIDKLGLGEILDYINVKY